MASTTFPLSSPPPISSPSHFPKYSAIFHPGQRRYAILYSIYKDEHTPIDVLQPAITAVERANNYTCIVIQDPRIPIGPQRHARFTTLSLTRHKKEEKQVWGYTGEQLFYTPISDWIPIICLHPGFPEGMEVWYGDPLVFPFRREPDGRADSEYVRAYLDMKESLATLPPASPPAPASQPAPASPPPPPPVPPHIPTFVGEALLTTARQKDETCPISMIPYKELSEVDITPCYHMFDHKCLEEWLANRTSCPTCNQPVEKKSVLLVKAAPTVPPAC